ncbi:carbon-nitrogen hydrolase family protein [Rhodobacter capsulatus]|jgi:predicted amidohydrolase|uniref:Hydrolase, carbon-nitrogen family n=1 Tax=Rhodobacter capsulatus (strain ATCC BAA-309 / NBRC 16581 / SB1003) TaxID=272942 RepID=D5ALA8_RHOCB|nr:carbon-nitrogen hydrolase family protein [Rhodobacter capsulatus]ADE83964.1 hydrolase, carbon-nitrogen family [Rhodobacter capsulatus SB 1003]ETD03082.1 amidohydrolase [Rhodobacter capsulatus DE442]ETD79352.1 amidohydrolase [Rhodobacter capsulatus R121]ETE55143.1 amidohydrolase [Rhodobacter capsulatus Y262]MDS0925560.1 carbon-nitrogen hydrolase family protein [Rhodobacter capsulatus]
MRAALVQLSVTDDPAANLPVTVDFIRQAAAGGAGFVLTPECTNLLSSDRALQRAVLAHEDEDATLSALRAEAERLGIWLLIGSLGLKTHDPDGRFANRSFLIGPAGQIVARYDKIHMFDVDVSPTERYRESEAYRPGTKAVLAEAGFARIGMAICYDLRFPQLFRRLSQAGAEVLTLPAAFNDTTGAAHWESLIRARAIENTCFVLAPAQCGTHAAHAGKPRRTHGHSLAVAPWGEVLADGGTEPGVTLVDLDLSRVAEARARVPSITHDRGFDGP